jgi:hypothetical protein
MAGEEVRLKCSALVGKKSVPRCVRSRWSQRGTSSLVVEKDVSEKRVWVWS